MLKITSRTEAARILLELEGKLAGPWVKELEECWSETGGDRKIKVMLRAVTFIDGAGRQLLTEMYANGVELEAEGCMTKAIVEEITRKEVHG
jgi:anti-anti-sigma regulatory factor